MQNQQKTTTTTAAMPGRYSSFSLKQNDKTTNQPYPTKPACVSELDGPRFDINY